MCSPIPALWGIASDALFLPTFLLVGATVLSTSIIASSQQMEELDSTVAAKLLIHVEKPNYPPIAKVNFIRGVVSLKIKVTSKGRVSEAHVIRGEPILAAAAINSVRNWRYRPYVSQEDPVPFSTYVTVGFKLKPHSHKGQLPENADGYLEKQVRPPEVVSRPQQERSSGGVRMKVLVGAKGEVVDATSSKAGEAELALARKSLRSWKFRPARWGALAVPWYVTVTVPLPYVAMDQTSDSAKH